MEKKLIKKIVIEGEIEALSGLHIGGTNANMGIGGPDKTVVRNPISNLPYIPGSSLKGKMRSLLELQEGTLGSRSMSKDIQNPPSDDPTSKAGMLFGAIPSDNKQTQLPSRILVRDAELINSEDIEGTDLPFTESKTEVVIDRITSKAMPRNMERVPAGAKFKLSMVINIFNGEDEAKLVKTAMSCLKLVEDDYLGGSGSRGSGQVKFHIHKMVERNKAYYEGTGSEIDLSNKY